jgi:hypothetical protein
MISIAGPRPSGYANGGTSIEINQGRLTDILHPEAAGRPDVKNCCKNLLSELDHIQRMVRTGVSRSYQKKSGTQRHETLAGL